MLRLRKILLSNYLYFISIILVLLISLIRLAFPLKSNCSSSSKSFTGIITKLAIKDEKLTLYIKSKESIIATCYLKKNHNIAKLNLGDTIKVTGSFKKASKNTSKYLFNYQKYLEQKNIFYLVEISTLTKLSSNHNIYYFLKQKLINHLSQNPYLYTFILGDKTYLSSNVKRSYQENGISHLFAISGMHITLLVSLIKRLLSPFKVREETLFKITTIILISYLLLTGLSPSILRGVLFYFLFSLNNIYYFYIKPLNIFLVILSISLLINPNYLYDVGFQYSFLISFTLLISTSYLNSSNYLQGLLKVSILSFLVSIPITLYNFYQLNFLGIIYNLFFVPFVSIIIFPLALITTLVKPILPVFNLLVKILEKVSLTLNHISIGKLIFKRIPLFFYFLYLLLIIIYLLTRQNKYLIIYLLILLVHYSLPLLDNSTFIKMIDVGQGDSILLKSHNKTVLIDTGGVTSYGKNNRDGKIFYNTLSPLFKSLGIKKIDYLILTHGDKDHLGEAQTILENMPVKKTIINSNRINYYEKKLLTKNTIIGKQNFNFKVGDLVFYELNENLIDENDSSQIYLVKYKNLKILFTGDASIKSEETLLKNYNLGPIDILKVGHHGSNTSTSEELLRETSPKVALISSGKDNKFNHPHQEIINRLKKFNLKIYNTQEVGTITIDLEKLTITTDA